jgi:hypothetical protein
MTVFIFFWLSVTDLDELILHGVRAIAKCVSSDKDDELSPDNVSIAVVGKETPYRGTS